MRYKYYVLATLLCAVGCQNRSGQEAAKEASKEAVKEPAVKEPEVKEVRVAAGTAIRVRLSETVDTERSRAGDAFGATLDGPLVVGDAVVVPAGARLRGRVVEADDSGRLKGRAVLRLKLEEIEWNGRKVALATSVVTRVSEGHKKRNAVLIGGGSGVGAAIGAAVGGGKGALIGAGAGAAAGTAGAAATGKRQIRLPAESVLTFQLKGPLVVEVPKTAG